MPATGFRHVLPAACLGVFSGTLDVTVVNIAIPDIRTELGASLVQSQWIVVAYSIAYAVTLLPSGLASDRYGAKRLLSAGFAVFVLASLIAAFSPSVHMLIAARTLAGVGAGLLAPASLGLLTTTLARARVATAIGIWSGSTALALAAGPLVGGLLVSWASWRAVFWVTVPLAALGLLLTLVQAPLRITAPKVRIDVWGVLLSALAIGGIVGGLVQAQSAGLLHAGIIMTIVIGLAAATGFIRRQLHTEAPLLRLETLRVPGFRLGLFGIFILNLAVSSIFVYLSIYYQESRGFSALATGLMFLPTTAATVVLAPFAGALTPRFGAFRIAGPALIISGVGLAGFWVLSGSAPVSALIAAQLLVGVGVGAAFSPLSSAVVANAPASEQSRASAADGLAGQLGIALGVTAIGFIITTASGSSSGSSVSASYPDAVALAAMLCAVATMVGGAWLLWKGRNLTTGRQG